MRIELPFKVFGTRILAVPVEEFQGEGVSKGGIVIPKTSNQNNAHKYRVVGVGDKISLSVSESDDVEARKLRVGDVIEARPTAGVPHRTKVNGHEVTLVLIQEVDVIGVY